MAGHKHWNSVSGFSPRSHGNDSTNAARKPPLVTVLSFFRQFAPELVMYSLGSRGVHALYLFLFWKKAQRRNDRVYATRQR
jgi:hypothetical protein